MAEWQLFDGVLAVFQQIRVQPYLGVSLESDSVYLEYPQFFVVQHEDIQVCMLAQLDLAKSDARISLQKKMRFQARLAILETWFGSAVSASRPRYQNDRKNLSARYHCLCDQFRRDDWFATEEHYWRSQSTQTQRRMLRGPVQLSRVTGARLPEYVHRDRPWLPLGIV